MTFPVQDIIRVICPHMKDHLRDLTLVIVDLACSDFSKFQFARFMFLLGIWTMRTKCFQLVTPCHFRNTQLEYTKFLRK